VIPLAREEVVKDKFAVDGDTIAGKFALRGCNTALYISPPAPVLDGARQLKVTIPLGALET